MGTVAAEGDADLLQESDTAPAPPLEPVQSPIFRRISEEVVNQGGRLLNRAWSVTNLSSGRSPAPIRRLGNAWSSASAINDASAMDLASTKDEEETDSLRSPGTPIMVAAGEEEGGEMKAGSGSATLDHPPADNGMGRVGGRLQRTLSSVSLFKVARIRRRKRTGSSRQHGVEASSAGPVQSDDTFDLVLLGSPNYVSVRYKDSSKLIHKEWKKKLKHGSRLNADPEYRMERSYCRQM